MKGLMGRVVDERRICNMQKVCENLLNSLDFDFHLCLFSRQVMLLRQLIACFDPVSATPESSSAPPIWLHLPLDTASNSIILLSILTLQCFDYSIALKFTAELKFRPQK